MQNFKCLQRAQENSKYFSVNIMSGNFKHKHLVKKFQYLRLLECELSILKKINSFSLKLPFNLTL